MQGPQEGTKNYASIWMEAQNSKIRFPEWLSYIFFIFERCHLALEWFENGQDMKGFELMKSRLALREDILRKTLLILSGIARKGGGLPMPKCFGPF